jgi:hypothetical protein
MQRFGHREHLATPYDLKRDRDFRATQDAEKSERLASPQERAQLVAHSNRSRRTR